MMRQLNAHSPIASDGNVRKNEEADDAIISLFVSFSLLNRHARVLLSGIQLDQSLDSRLRGNDTANYFSTLSNCAAAASTKALNNGCGRLGRLLNSGWNCDPTMNG